VVSISSTVKALPGVKLIGRAAHIGPLASLLLSPKLPKACNI
jgi:hypothetical protein